MHFRQFFAATPKVFRPLYHAISYITTQNMASRVPHFSPAETAYDYLYASKFKKLTIHSKSV